MQIVCESCGATGAAASIDVIGGQVHVTCASCGIASVAGNASAKEEPVSGPSVADDTATNLPPTKCPKCGHRQHDKVACHKCGLVFAKAKKRGGRPWDAAPAGKEEVVSKARLLWAKVEAEPSDEHHQSFVEHVRRSGIAAWAAMRYRHWLADYPHDEVAKRHMETVVADAQAIAAALASSGTAEAYAANAKKVRAVLVLVVVLMCAGIIGLGVKLVGAGSVAPF